MRRFSRAFCLVMAIAAALAAWCAPKPPTPVVWTASIDSISPAKGVVVLHADILDKYHIYGMERPAGLDIPVTLTSMSVTADNVELGDITADPAPSTHTDMVFNADIQWWEHQVTLRQPFTLANGAEGTSFTVEVECMACTDQSCTAPSTKEFSLVFGKIAPAAPAAAEEESLAAAQPSQAPDASQWWEPVDFKSLNTAISVDTSESSWWMLLVMGFLGGLLALLTPCVWPMIPMTVSFFLKSNKDKRRAMVNAVVYGLSIVVIFLVLGLAITLIFGAGTLNALSTSAIFNIIFFLLLVVFAISFFGAFDITLPSKWSNKMDGMAESTTGIISIFFMAFTLVLVSFSCTGPIIGTLLVEAASQKSILGPALGMGGFALGLAIPFTLFAAFPSFLKSMPKSGGWLNSVKVVLGFIELILSLKFLSVADLAYGWGLLNRDVFLAIWIVLFVLLGMYLLGKLRFSHDSEQKHTSVLGLFLAILSFSYAVYLVPGLWGAPLKSTSAFAPPLFTQTFNLYDAGLSEYDDYDEGMAAAARMNKPVFMDFTGYGCVNCRKMEVSVFDDPAVKKMIDENFVVIKLFVDDKKPLDKPYTVEIYGEIRKIKTVGDKWTYLQEYKFGINSQPYYVLLNNAGQPLAAPRVYDENVDAFLNWLSEGYNAYVDQNSK